MYRFNDSIMKNQFLNVSENYILNQLYKDKRTIKGFITNATLSPNSSYHLHSMKEFNRGEIVTLKGKYYMVSGDVILDRVSKYKGILDYCNFQHDIMKSEKVLIGVDNLGRPIYETRQVLDRSEYGILRYKDISVETNSAINSVMPIYTLFLRDTEDNRSYFTVNQKINIGDKLLSIFNIIYTKQGLLEIRLQ